MDIVAQARLLQPYILNARRRLHNRPELGFEEKESSDFIAGELEALGYSVTRLSPTGIMAELSGNKSGATVLLRADMDALPIEEKTGLPFASCHEGISHACGHDIHSAMLLGAAKLLLERRSELNGNVRFLFQPAEEMGNGALHMITQGVLDGVDACFAEHVAPLYDVGMIAIGKGQLMAGAGTFKITVNGKSCHGAMPQLGADALLAGAQIVVALQSIVSREINPMTRLVITVGTFHSGDRYNVVSGESVIEGTVRALDGKLLDTMGEKLERIASNVAEAYRCTAQTEYKKTCESLVADAAIADVARSAAQKIQDSALIYDLEPQMGSEDFSDIAVKRPSTYAVIGVGGEYPLHNERFNADESAMPVGAALYAQFAIDYLTSKV